MTLFPASFLAALIVGSLVLTAVGVIVLAVLFIRDFNNKSLW